MANEIIISTNESEIRSMLIKLMGRGLILSQEVRGHYKLNLDEIMDLIAKIGQRVRFQNHCEMSDFHGTFEFDDGSKETVPSFSHLENYRSINNSICTRAHFSFAFLININSRGVEKQSIDIEIKNGGSKNIRFLSPIFEEDFSEDRLGTMMINIEYTDITWANDIKNIFEKYAETHVEKFERRSKISRFIGYRGVLVILFPFTMIATLFLSFIRKDPQRIKNSLDAYTIDINKGDEIAIINRKIDFLILGKNQILSAGDIAVFISTILSFFVLFYFVGLLIRNIPISAILLSPEASKVYERTERSRSNVNKLAFGGIGLSVLISVVSARLDSILVWILS